MDIYFKKKFLGFSIDSLFPNNLSGYAALVIPDINSQFFPPHHLRTINISPHLLERTFYLSQNTDAKVNYEFRGSVIQGGYYKIPTERLKHVNAFNDKTIIDLNDDIFFGHQVISPYLENEIQGNRLLYSQKAYAELSTTTLKCNTFLYCFNVGQSAQILDLSESAR